MGQLKNMCTQIYPLAFSTGRGASPGEESRYSQAVYPASAAERVSLIYIA